VPARRPRHPLVRRPAATARGSSGATRRSTCAPSNAPAVLNGTIIAAGVALAAGALALAAATLALAAAALAATALALALAAAALALAATALAAAAFAAAADLAAADDLAAVTAAALALAAAGAAAQPASAVALAATVAPLAAQPARPPPSPLGSESVHFIFMRAIRPYGSSFSPHSSTCEPYPTPIFLGGGRLLSLSETRRHGARSLAAPLRSAPPLRSRPAPAPPRGQAPGAHAQKQLGYDHGCVSKRYGGLVMSLMTMALCDRLGLV
jgi:hypothetical protein